MKKIFFFVCIIIALLTINGLVQSIYSLWQKQDLIQKAEKELQHEKAENASLKGKLQEVTKPEFVEKEARDKLFLVKPGEQIVLLPKTTPTPVVETKADAAKPNWKQWWEVFTK